MIDRLKDSINAAICAFVDNWVEWNSVEPKSPEPYRFRSDCSLYMPGQKVWRRTGRVWPSDPEVNDKCKDCQHFAKVLHTDPGDGLDWCNELKLKAHPDGSCSKWEAK